MRALLIGADQNNATDGQIVEGIRHILRAKYPGFKDDYVFIDDHAPMTTEDFHIERCYDLLVICGTPWIWDHFWSTHKYRNLVRAKIAHPEAKVVFMGIGACMNLDDVGGVLLTRDKERAKLQEAFGKATVIVRDSIAKSLLDNAGVESELLPCPAYWAYGLDPRDEVLLDSHSVLVWYDPRIGVSAGDWSDKNKFEAYAAKFLDFYNQFKPSVRVAKSEDIKGALEIGLPKPEVFEGHAHARACLSQARRVFSGRVHNAVPAVRNGSEVTLVAVDSRWQTFWDFFEYKPHQFANALSRYFEVLL